MSNCVIDKFKLWSLLEDDALDLSAWLLSDDDHAKTCKYIFDSVTNINLADSIILDKVLPYFIEKKIISYRTVKRITDYVENNIKRDVL